MREVGLIFFLLGLFGFVVQAQTFINSLIGLEMIFISAVYLLSFTSIEVNDLCGQTACMVALAVAASESAVGLAILVQYYRVRGAVETQLYPTLKG
jgi:NADH:ubiquinone oxidoreductase subunit K